MKALLTAIALVLSTTAFSNAATDVPKSDVLAGGPLFDSTQDEVVCLYTNVGSTNITPVSQQLFEEDSTTALSSTNVGCANNSAVVPNQTYSVNYRGVPLQPILCKITFSGPATAVRGSMQMFDGSNNSLSIVDLR